MARKKDPIVDREYKRMLKSSKEYGKKGIREGWDTKEKLKKRTGGAKAWRESIYKMMKKTYGGKTEAEVLDYKKKHGLR
jgi:hypothetical protein